MKMKKILAVVLSVALLLGSVPNAIEAYADSGVTPLTSQNGEDITLLPTDDYSEYVTLNGTKQKLENNVPIWAVGNTGDVNYDRPYIYGSFPGQTTANGANLATYGFSEINNDTGNYRWDYIAIKTSVEINGTYQISAELNRNTSNATSTRKNVMVVVDGMMHYATCENTGKIDSPTEISLSLELTEGEHIILFSFPVNNDYDNAKAANSATWINYHSITVDGDMTVLGAPTIDDVTTSITSATRIEAEDTNYAILSGGYAKRDANTASDKKSVSYNSNYGLDSNEIAALAESIRSNNVTTNSYCSFVDKNLALPYVEYQLQAEESGKYNLRLGAFVRQVGEFPTAALVANGTVYKSPFNIETSGKYCNAYFSVQLQKGINTIRVIGMALDMTDVDKLSYDDGQIYDIQPDYLEIDSNLNPVQVGMQTIEAANTENVSFGHFNDENKTDTALKNCNPGDIQYDKLTLDRLNVGILSRVPYVSVKVEANEDGYYNVAGNFETATNGQKNIGVIIDGEVYVTTISPNFSVRLTKGTHVITFTSPMPVTKADIGTNNNTYNWPWMDVYSISVDQRLTVKTAPTKEEIIPVTRLEAENTEYAFYNRTSAGVYAKKSYNGAGSNALIHITSTAKLTQSLSQLEAGLDTGKTPYVRYLVNAENAGEYELGIGMYAEGSGTTKPSAIVMVNGDVYEVPFKSELNSLGHSTVTVELQEGINEIRLIAGITDQGDTVKLQYDYIDIPKGVVPMTNQIINGADSEKVSFGHYDDKDKEDTALKGAQAGDAAWDKLTIDHLNYGALTRTPYVAIKVTAPEDGSYYIAGNFGFDGNNCRTIGLIVDKDVQTVTLTPDLTLKLTKGEHVIIFTSPMPQNRTAMDGKTDAYNWSWMDVYSIVVDERLTVKEAPVIENLIPGRLEAEDDIYASYNQTSAGTYKHEKKNGASGNAVAGGVNFDRLSQTAEDVKEKLGISKTPYIQYILNAPAAGEYELGIGMFVDSKNKGEDKPYATIMVNDKVYQAEFTADWFSSGHATVTVEMQEGMNIVRLVSVTCEQDAYKYERENGGWVYINYDYLDIPEEIVPVENTQVIKAGDETKVRINKFKDNGDIIGNVSWADASWDRMTIDKITLNNLERTAYAAFKVSAVSDGTYDIIVQSSWAEANATTDTIAVFVDGVPTAVPYTVKIDSAIRINVELTKGEHVIVLTSPLPATQEILKKNAPDLYNANPMTVEINGQKATQYAYPAIDYSNIILGNGLSVVAAAPTKSEVEYPGYNRIQAEDNDYAVYNLYSGEAEKWSGASGGSVIGGFSTGGVQSYEDIVANGLDMAHVGVIEYLVTAPKAGEYSIRVAYLAGKPKDSSVEKPYVTVVINDSEKVYKAPYDAEWKEIDEVELKVTLKEGRNYIRITGITGDQASYKVGGSYINHDYVDFQEDLTVEKRTAVVFEAEDSQYVNLYKVQPGEKVEKASNDKVLGGSVQTEMIRRELTVEGLREKDLGYVPYFSVTIDVPADGYYSMRLNHNARSLDTTTYLAMVIDGKVHVVKYGRVSADMNKNTVDVSSYLTAGEHTITFTCPMPLNAQDEQIYMWMNFDKVTFYDGITIAKTQKAPAAASETLIFEAEDYALANMGYIIANESYSGGANIGDIRCKKTQTLAEIKKNGIDGNRTPYTQFTIYAKEAGEYEISALYRYAFWSEEPTIKDEIDTTFVISANGKYYPVTKKAGTGTRTRYIGATISLQKGENKVLFICPTRDSHRGEGYVWANIDYVEIPKEYESKLSFVKLGGVVEAELSEFANYDRTTSKKASGGRRIGNATYANMDRLDITWDNLDVNNLSEVPHVVYNVIAEKAGTYDISVQFNGGTDTYKQEEMDALGPFTFAMSINGGEKQKVQFVPGTSGGLMSRIITVDLQEGENLITFTTLLADYFKGVSPSDPVNYRLYWVDHDAIFLSSGLTGAVVEEKSVDDSDVDYSQIKVKGRSNSAAGEDSEQTESNGFFDFDKDGTGMIVGGTSILLLVAILFIILILLKRRKKEEKQE
ncbi:MAG: hypothetical protein IJZ53_05875 [Tyzzerella sp.]|nr:hypothetical protein [Tyzzerella sp.]